MKTIALMIAAALTLTSCIDDRNSAGVRYVQTQDAQAPVDVNGYTSEQNNILKRRKIALDPKQIMWIYCLADNGQVVFYGAVKGKVTSSGKSLQSVMNISDGTEGSSDAYVYWFDPSDKYFQWNGHYFLSTYEIKIMTPVLNTRSVQ